MERRIVFLFILSFLMFAEGSSWIMANGLGPCLVEPERSQQSADHNSHQNCPTLLAGTFLVFERGLDVLKRDDNDKAVVAGFTIVLAISTIGLWLATNKLWSTGERQIKLLAETSAAQSRDMQASIKVAQTAVKAAQKSADAAELSMVEADRPWIEVDIKISGPLIFTHEGIEISAEAKFKNTGRSPAINVGFEFKLCPDVGEASRFASDSAKIMRRSFTTTLGTGQVIYPGKDAKISDTLRMKRGDFIARIREIDAVESEDKTEPFVANNPALMAFVWYGLPKAGRSGKFRFSTGLFEVCWSADFYKGFDGSVMTAPLDQLELVATYYSGEFA